MKLVDTNVWLALALSQHHQHASAARWISGETSAAELAFCRSTQVALLRLLTTAAVLSPYGNPPLSNTQAWRVYDSLLADPRVSFLPEPHNLDPAWRTFADRHTASPKLWMDAYLAAFAMAGQFQFVTFDVAFKQFSGVDVLVLS